MDLEWEIGFYRPDVSMLITEITKLLNEYSDFATEIDLDEVLQYSFRKDRLKSAMEMPIVDPSQYRSIALENARTWEDWTSSEIQYGYLSGWGISEKQLLALVPHGRGAIPFMRKDGDWICLVEESIIHPYFLEGSRDRLAKEINRVKGTDTD